MGNRLTFFMAALLLYFFGFNQTVLADNITVRKVLQKIRSYYKQQNQTTHPVQNPVPPPTPAPNNPTQPSERTPFGLHAAGSGTEAKDIGASIVRKMLRWGDAEPAKGSYQTELMDKSIKQTADHGLSIVVSLVAASPWGTNPAALQSKCGSYTCTGIPTDHEAWKNFIRTIVERYDGDGNQDMPGLKHPIKYWQIENEWLAQWKNSAEDYLAHLKETSETVKQADPEAKIILAGATARLIAAADGYWQNNTVQTGTSDADLKVLSVDEYIHKAKNSPRYKTAKQKLELIFSQGHPYFDIVDFHTYGEPEEIVASANFIKDLMHKNGYAKPIWSLEAAAPFFNFTEEKFTEDVIKLYQLGLGSGVEKIFWSSLVPTLAWNENFLRLALIDTNKRKTSAYYAYKLAAEKLKGYRSTELVNSGANVRVFKNTTETGEVYVGWSTTGQFENITLPFPNAKQVKVTNSRATVNLVSVTNGSVALSLSSPVFIEPA